MCQINVSCQSASRYLVLGAKGCAIRHDFALYDSNRQAVMNDVDRDQFDILSLLFLSEMTRDLITNQMMKIDINHTDMIHSPN